jgi:hypothetical protein
MFVKPGKNGWLKHVDMTNGLSFPHIQELFDLWAKLQDVELKHRLSSPINLVSKNKSSIKGNSLGLSIQRCLVWLGKTGPSKIKFFSWLIIQVHV